MAWLRSTRILILPWAILLGSCSGNTIQTKVFSDGFQEMSTGVITLADTVNPAIYYRPGRGVAGEWRVATSLRQDGFDRAWQIREREGVKYLAQTFSNLDPSDAPHSLTTHPIIVTGDSLWSDYKIELDFTPLAKFDKCGLVFGYQHPNEFFFFGTEGNTVILKHIRQSVTPLRPIEQILEYRPLVWTPGEPMKAVLTVRRNKISTILNDTLRMYEEVDGIAPGRIGVISDMPAEFHRVEVRLLRGEQRKLSRRKRQINRQLEIRVEDHPAMVRWKHFDTEAFGADQNLRLGDLTGDGNKEVLLARGNRKGREVVCMTALKLDGEVLWQYGSAQAPFEAMGPELAFQIHDLDGDGGREVIFSSMGEIRVLDGKTGELVSRSNTGSGPPPHRIQFGDLLGTGRDNCMILVEADSRIRVFSERLELLWETVLDHASLPLLTDLDRNGRDEVLSGFTVLTHDGIPLFRTGEFIGDKCNGISMNQLTGLPPSIIYAAGDWGLMHVDFRGSVLKQNILGHVKYITVADLDAESPGLEVVTANSWGSDGLIHILDAGGVVRKSFVAASGISRCVPVNWKGDGEEFLLISSDTLSGGLFNKEGELAVRFPSDGHPVLCHTVQDLTGDVRDEILVWDQDDLWIYTQDDNPRMGMTYKPERLPLYNYSNHRMNLSLPGW